MSQIIAYKLEGKIHLLIPAPGVEIEQLIDLVPQDFIEIEDSQLPDRFWRNSWDIESQEIKVPRAKAKAQKLQQIRALRDAKLAALDGDHLRYLDANDNAKIQQIRTKKQALRDATEPLKSGALDGLSLEELKRYLPSVLEPDPLQG